MTHRGLGGGQRRTERPFLPGRQPLQRATSRAVRRGDSYRLKDQNSDVLGTDPS